MRALVCGESEVAFEIALQNARTAEDGQISPISVEQINLSLNEVTVTVFPHQALESQRLWMNRKMFKPIEMTTRKMAASINRLNNALPFIPTATEASKFSEIELIGLLEWSLPATWSAKFDLDSYIPTLHSRARLIEACEAIEQSEIAVERPSREESSQNHRNIKRSAAKNSAETQKQKKQEGDGKHYCSEHGYNPTHSTGKLWHPRVKVMMKCLFKSSALLRRKLKRKPPSTPWM
jgi:hypothetical protein